MKQYVLHWVPMTLIPLPPIEKWPDEHLNQVAPLIGDTYDSVYQCLEILVPEKRHPQMNQKLQALSNTGKICKSYPYGGDHMPSQDGIEYCFMSWADNITVRPPVTWTNRSLKAIVLPEDADVGLSLIHISEPTRPY